MTITSTRFTANLRINTVHSARVAFSIVLLITSACIFLALNVDLLWSRHIIIGLVAFSVVINSLATVSWLVDADLNVPAETRAAWEKLLGRHSYERWK